MDAVTIAFVLLGSAFIGFLFAPLGLGGGLLFAPLLHYGAGWDIDGALLIVSLGLSGTVAYGSGLRHRKEGFYSDKRLKEGLFGAIPGAIIGVVIVASLSGSFDVLFKALSLGFVTWAIIKTIRARSKKETIEESASTIPLQIGVGIGGMLSSVLAIGAGAIYVPVLKTYGSLQSRKAIGTSLHIMMCVIPLSIIAHLFALNEGQFEVLKSNLVLILLLPFVVIIAANVGARFGIAKVSEHRIMQVFVAILFIIGIRYMLDLMDELFS
ncbi:MAG: sulfite exporter TauE/SafE family protein [Candidatus Poseidoniaceae archaeon]